MHSNFRFSPCIITITFISRLMHSIIQNLEVKIYVAWKFKRHKIKNHSNMFRMVCDPSSRSTELYLTEITLSGSQMFLVCLVGVWQRNFELVVCVCGTHTTSSKLRCQTPTKHTTNISEPLRVISVKYSSVLPDDGSHTIRNMLEWFLILSFFKLLCNVDFNL